MNSSIPTAQALDFPVSGAGVRQGAATDANALSPERDARPRWRLLPGLVPVAADLFGAGAAVAAIAIFDQGALPSSAVIAPALYLCINWACGLYRFSAGPKPLVSRRVVLALLLTTALFAWSVSLLERSAANGDHLALWIEAAILLSVFGSGLLSRVAADNMRRKFRPERWLVVGTSDAAWRVQGALESSHVAEVVATEPLAVNGFSALDGRAEAMETLKRFQVDRVVLAPRGTDPRTTVGLIHTFKSLGVEISLLAPSLDHLDGVRYRSRTRMAAGVPMIDIGSLTANGDGRARLNSAGHPDRSGKPPRVSVVIPTLNEAENLPHVLNRLPEGLHEVILIDGGSADDTVRVARELLPDIRVLFQAGRGKGDALRTGFAAVTGDIIVMLDADGSTDPGEIPNFVDQLQAGADFAKGSRFIGAGGSDDITPTRQVGNWALSRTVNALYGTRYSDLCYGYNAFWTHCLPYISLDTPGFEVETLMSLRAAKAGLNVSEVPSFEARRLYGQSKLNTYRDGFRVMRTIVKERSG